jgi:hypothetical protein
LLTGDQRAVDRYLVTGIRELTKGQREMKTEIATMRQTCETRGLMCPGMHGYLADPVDDHGPPSTLYAPEFEAAAESRQEYAADAIERNNEAKLRQRVWAMWGVGIFLAVTLANALMTYGFDKLLHP